MREGGHGINFLLLPPQQRSRLLHVPRNGEAGRGEGVMEMLKECGLVVRGLGAQLRLIDNSNM